MSECIYVKLTPAQNYQNEFGCKKNDQWLENSEKKLISSSMEVSGVQLIDNDYEIFSQTKRKPQHYTWIENRISYY